MEHFPLCSNWVTGPSWPWGHGHACCYHHFPHLQKPTPTTPPSYTHSTTVKSSPLHLLWYKKLIVVCCLLIVYWSSGSQLTIPLQTASPPCPCMGIVDEFGGQSYRLYRSMVGCWGKDWCHVGTWGTQLDGAIAVRTTLGGENSILSLGGAPHKFLAGIRANQNSANVGAYTPAGMTTPRWDIFRFWRCSFRNLCTRCGPPWQRCERGFVILQPGLA